MTLFQQLFRQRRNSHWRRSALIQCIDKLLPEESLRQKGDAETAMGVVIVLRALEPQGKEPVMLVWTEAVHEVYSRFKAEN